MQPNIWKCSDGCELWEVIYCIKLKVNKMELELETFNGEGIVAVNNQYAL